MPIGINSWYDVSTKESYLLSDNEQSVSITPDGVQTSITVQLDGPIVLHKGVSITYSIGGSSFTVTSDSTGQIADTNVTGSVDASGNLTLSSNTAFDTTPINIVYYQAFYMKTYSTICELPREPRVFLVTNIDYIKADEDSVEIKYFIAGSRSGMWFTPLNLATGTIIESLNFSQSFNGQIAYELNGNAMRLDIVFRKQDLTIDPEGELYIELRPYPLTR